MFGNITLLVNTLHDLKFTISCQKYHDPTPFFHVNPQLKEGMSPGVIDN